MAFSLAPRAGLAPVRGPEPRARVELGERLQHEPALVQARVRDGQARLVDRLRRRRAAGRGRSSAAPSARRARAPSSRSTASRLSSSSAGESSVSSAAAPFRNARLLGDADRIGLAQLRDARRRPAELGDRARGSSPRGRRGSSRGRRRRPSRPRRADGRVLDRRVEHDVRLAHAHRDALDREAREQLVGERGRERLEQVVRTRRPRPRARRRRRRGSRRRPRAGRSCRPRPPPARRRRGSAGPARAPSRARRGTRAARARAARSITRSPRPP